MIIKVPVYFEIEGLEGAKIDHDYLKSKVSDELYQEIERYTSLSQILVQGGFWSSAQTVKANFRTPSEVHEILRTKR
jgi:hypothetical protein